MAADWQTVAKARTDFADMLDTLTDEQLATQSLCELWSVADVAGHLTSLVETSVVSLVIGTVKNGGDFDAFAASTAPTFAEKGPKALSASLRSNASKKMPFFSEASMVADTAVHTQDVRRPLGLPANLDPQVLQVSLDYSVGEFAKKRKDAAAPKFQAIDMDWSWGDGPEIKGTGEALLMALNDRDVAAELTGDGLSLLKTP